MYNPVVNNPKSNNQYEEKRDAKGNNTESTFQFQDQRPEGIIQSKLQNLAHTSSKLNKDIVQYQNMANEHASRQKLPVQKRENTTGLPDGLKAGVENLSGHSLDDVKVHYNSDKPAQLQAHAYAQGTDIHVAQGQEKHLPHEAWHVVQQKQGRVKPTLQMKTGVAVNDDTGLEKEADVMGAKALQLMQNGEIETPQNNHSQTGEVAQLQAKEDETEAEPDEEAVSQEELQSLLDAMSAFSLSDVEEVDESESDSGESEISEEEPATAIDDSEEIQLVKNNAVIQMERGPFKRDKNYYLNKLARSIRFLLKSKKLIETGEAKFKSRKEAEQMHKGLDELFSIYTRLKESPKTKLSSETRMKIDRMTFQHNRIYFRILSEKIERDRKHLFFSKTEEEGVDKSAAAAWYEEIKGKNSRILNIMLSAPEPTKHAWFMMDYEDIVDSQAEQANEAIEKGIPYLMEQGKNDLDFVKNNIITLISKSHYYLPLVTFNRAEFRKINESPFIAVDYQINPSYTKYVDPTKKGQGSQAIQILGDSTDKKVKTDIKFIPGSLTIGDETSQVGMQMEATRLSQDTPIGSEAGKDSSQDNFMGNLKKTMGDKRTKYIKGHLLNDHLGGPARPYNLFPITDQANSDHLVFMEKYVKAEVEKGYVMYYKVNIASPKVTDRESSKGTDHTRRYSVDADIQCESAKLDPSEKPIEKHQITVKSVWGGGEVLDSTGSRIRRKSDLSSTGSALETHADYTRKLTSGKANEGVTNPDVIAPDSKKHLIYKKSGYNQNGMHKGKLSDSDLTSTVTGAIPFSISGDKDDISTALQVSVASAVGKHIAGLIWSSSFITSGKLKAGITELELKSIKGVGPASIKKLKDNFEIK
jgi:hypothetical protein